MGEHKSSARRVPLRNLSAEEEDALTWNWVVSRLTDEAHDIHAALDEHTELGSPDWSAALTLWSLQFQGLQLVAKGDPDPSVRKRFERALAERRRVMNAILARVRKGRKEVWPVVKERVNGH
jgi:hypothetical protein